MNTRPFLFITLFIILSGNICNSHAHGRYILPSHTVLSGKYPQSVTLLASISNDFFHADRPLGNNNMGIIDHELEGLFRMLEPYVIDPEGKVSKHLQWQAFSRLSVADLELEKPGTYRIGIMQKPTRMITFKYANGKPGRIIGSGKIPANATDIIRHLTSSRTESHISLNGNNTTALQIQGKGLEMAFISHPNDLFINEPARFQLYLDGKPLTQKININITHEDTRHRNQRETLQIETGGHGKVTASFSQPGFYLLEASLSTNNSGTKNIDMEHHTLYLTLEVFN